MSKDPLDHFPRASSAVKPRLVWASYGEVGSGKTHFALSAPGPIVVQSFDRGLEGVVEPFVTTGKDVRVVEYEWSPTDQLAQDEAIKLRDRFIRDYEIAIQHAKTVLWDRESDIWELFRYAEFGAPSDAPKNYSALNQRYRKYINMAKATDINFGCIQSVKTAWDSTINPRTGREQPRPTKERERTGFKELEGIVHIDLHHRREDGHFYIDVGKSRGPGGQDVQDQSFMDFSFTDLAMMIFPDTSEADWQ